MSPDHASVAILHQCTGNQIKILIALKLLGLDAAINQIAATSNINRNSVSEALSALAALGYVESIDRYHWRLSAATTQLPLWTPTQLAESSDSSVDAKNLCVPCSSSNKLPGSMDQTTTTTPPLDAKKLCVQQPTPTVAALMQLGASRTQAETAINRARASGLTVTVEHITAWQHYCRDRPTINNPPGFACARLAAGQTAPADPHTSPEHMTAEERQAYYVPPSYEHLIEH